MLAGMRTLAKDFEDIVHRSKDAAHDKPLWGLLDIASAPPKIRINTRKTQNNLLLPEDEE
jgi:hypothetical protein